MPSSLSTPGMRLHPTHPSTSPSVQRLLHSQQPAYTPYLPTLQMQVSKPCCGLVSNMATCLPRVMHVPFCRFHWGRRSQCKGLNIRYAQSS